MGPRTKRSAASPRAGRGCARLRLGPAVGVDPAGEVHVIRRRRLIDGRPVLVERIVVNPAVAPDLLRFSFDGSLTAIRRDHYYVAVVRNVVDMQPCALVRDEADTLGVKSGTPGLSVIRTSFDVQGRVVEFDQEFWRHVALRVQVETRVDRGPGSAFHKGYPVSDP